MSMPDNGFRHENVCSYCGHHVSRAFMPEDEDSIPVPGNLSICIRCGACSKFNDDMKLVPFDLNQLNLKEAQHVNRLQVAVLLANKEMNSKIEKP